MKEANKQLTAILSAVAVSSVPVFYEAKNLCETILASPKYQAFVHHLAEQTNNPHFADGMETSAVLGVTLLAAKFAYELAQPMSKGFARLYKTRLD